VARLTIEVAVARLAARRALANPAGIERLRLTVESLERVADPEQVPLRLDIDFHRGVVELTANAYLTNLLEPIWVTRERAPLAHMLPRPWSAEDTKRTASEHRAIFEALRVGNPELAGFAMERHLRSLAALIFEDGSFDGPPSRYYG
jgi:GntR family transcriptional repressor for pyruvate dehydrogenase complex